MVADNADIFLGWVGWSFLGTVLSCLSVFVAGFAAARAGSAKRAAELAKVEMQARARSDTLINELKALEMSVRLLKRDVRQSNWSMCAANVSQIYITARRAKGRSPKSNANDQSGVLERIIISSQKLEVLFEGAYEKNTTESLGSEVQRLLSMLSGDCAELAERVRSEVDD